MSPLLIALRRGSAPVAVPVMVALGLFAGSRGGESVDWGWTSGQLQQHGVLLVPLTAAIAAWDTSRWRRTSSALPARTFPRSPATWAMINCIPALLAGFAGWGAAFALMAAGTRGSGGPYWSVVLLGPLTFVAGTLVGAVAGRLLPRHLAAPLVAVLVWLSLAFGSSSTDPVLARLSAVDRACCDVTTQPLAETVTGQWLWIAALVLSAAAVLAWPSVIRSAPLGVLGATAAVFGVSLIVGTGGQLTVPRTPTAEACGTRDGVTVCMWPEHGSDVTTWLDAVGTYRALFADLGASPALYLESGLRPGADVARVGAVRPGMGKDDLVLTLARQHMPSPPECARTETGSGPFPAATSRVLVDAWLTHRVRPDTPPAALVPVDRAAQFTRLVESPVERQRQWYADVVAAHRDCVTPAPAVS
ncbi:hypothetical protein [Actinosynnema sp. NPDC023587]|uniref:DUF7224 domain-containing protein n=1 Tax=Actinosynnema sp. NPDC023587 TaxID=3154695 RepID=UPI0033D7F464